MVSTARRRRFSGIGAAAVSVLLAACLQGAAVGAADGPPTAAPADAIDAQGVRDWVAAGADSLDASFTRLEAALASGAPARPDSLRVHEAFVSSRAAYKSLEGVVEFYTPALAAALNSRRQEVDDDDAPPPGTVAAAGYPAVEPLLWPTLSRRSADSAAAMIAGMHGVAGRIKSLSSALQPTDAQIAEIARLEMARVATLGITAFDAPITLASLHESAEAIDGLRALLAAAGGERRESVRDAYQAADSTLAAAARALGASSDFATFDRLGFIAFDARPAAHALDDLRRAEGAVPISIQRFWRAEAPSPFDADAFDPAAFAAGDAPAPSPEIVALGRRLFADPVLSGPGTRACASCHKPDHAFTDGLPRAASLTGKGTAQRHTPTLIGAGLAPVYFADERSPTLEEQVIRVLANPREMGSSIEGAAAAVGARAADRAQFAAALGGPEEGAVTPLRLREAIAAYVRSLQGLNTRFDRAARGDTALLSTTERRGFDVFMGKAGCGTCHFAPLFNGTTPPLYRSADVEVIGTPALPTQLRVTDPDSGRAAVDGLPLHYRAFKTPTVRNATLTAPYMHNGAFRTLDQVIDLYDKGGGAGAGANVPNQTLSPVPLHLTKRERADLIAFLGALTDTVTAPAR